MHVLGVQQEGHLARREILLQQLCESIHFEGSSLTWSYSRTVIVVIAVAVSQETLRCDGT